MCNNHLEKSILVILSLKSRYDMTYIINAPYGISAQRLEVLVRSQLLYANAWQLKGLNITRYLAQFPAHLSIQATEFNSTGH